MYVKNIIKMLKNRRAILKNELKSHKELMSKSTVSMSFLEKRINEYEIRLQEINEIFLIIKDVINMINKKDDDLLSDLMEKEGK